MLDSLPVGLFGSVIGVAGLSVAWQLAHARYGTPEYIAVAIAVVALAAFALMLGAYVIKTATAFASAREEYRHPVVANLFGTILIGLMQLPIVLGPFAHRLAQILWMLGAGGAVLLVVITCRHWVANRRQRPIGPACMIPIVGVLNMPLAAPGLGLPHMHELMIAALVVGLLMSMPVFALIAAHLLVAPHLPAALRPSVLILVAPFAVGCSAYTVTLDRIDIFAEMLFTANMLLLVILIGQLRFLHASCPFRLSWWSVGFPLAASAVAALRLATARPDILTDAIALTLLALATLVISWLLVRTLADISKRGIPLREVGYEGHGPALDQRAK
jgi:tellurite resistance protein